MWVQPLFSCLDFCSPVFPLKRVCLEVKGEDISMIACMQRLSFHHQIFYFSPLGLSYLHTGWKMEWYPCQVESNLICTKGKKEGIIRSLYSYARTYTGDAYGFTSTYTVVFNFLSPPVFLHISKRWCTLSLYHDARHFPGALKYWAVFHLHSNFRHCVLLSSLSHRWEAEASQD